MDNFRCKYLTHENEEIIGFCLNQNCQNATLYCYECLTTTHQDHFNDCIRFPKIDQYMNEFIQVYNQSTKQFKKTYFSVVLKKLKKLWNKIQTNQKR
ncbi:unnamed protein product [Paramecium primaurelia]|uniref:Uncharacterized protein n=1 Tax=Paramecium primaurelia TaxID=5886 RepID=A0A8S1NZC0_PARPR|nr:unnamed protein product [Paramecium primaurelia]